ncbi:MAG: hypothetical protein HPY71_16060 [Firmicutes bacterium]|nr:hypothetical protein [Bacillota bacterium]
MTQRGRESRRKDKAEIRNRLGVDKGRFFESERLEGMREDPMNSDVTLVRVDAADADEVSAAHAWGIMDPVEMPAARRLEEIAEGINEGINENEGEKAGKAGRSKAGKSKKDGEGEKGYIAGSKSTRH